MIEARLAETEGNIMQLSQKRKNDQQDNLLEELLREKAAVLSRAGMAVEDVIEQLMRIDKEIEVKISLLNTFCWNLINFLNHFIPPQAQCLSCNDQIIILQVGFLTNSIELINAQVDFFTNHFLFLQHFRGIVIPAKSV